MGCHPGDEHPREATGEEPADQSPADVPSSAFVSPSESLIAGSRGSTAAAIAPCAKNSVLTAIRARRARAASMDSVMEGPMVPDVRRCRAPPPSHGRGTCPIVTPMPELPEVETVARDLRRRLCPRWRRGGTTGPRASRGPGRCATRPFIRGVTGRRIEVDRAARKQVVIDLSGGAVLTVHLKMTGQVFVVPGRLPDDPYDDSRSRSTTVPSCGSGTSASSAGSGSTVGTDDDPARTASGFDQLGPEPLDSGVHAGAVPVVIRGRRARLKPLLVDQAFLAGVGNIYADEALWRRGSIRCASAPSLRRATSAPCTTIREILAEAIVRRGSSIDDYTAPEGDGEMQERLQVYQRTGEPCPRCGHPIRRIVLGIRATHFCSWCQRLPAQRRRARCCAP